MVFLDIVLKNYHNIIKLVEVHLMNNINIFAFADEASEGFDGQIKAMIANKLNGIEIRGVDGVNISDISVEKAREIKKN